MVKEELAHAIATWASRQQALRQSVLSAASTLHAGLVELRLTADEEGVAMRERHERAVAALHEVGRPDARTVHTHTHSPP